MSGDCLLGIDVGTSGVRGAVFTGEGLLLAVASVPTSHRAPAPGHAESDPEGWWVSACAVTRRLAQHVPPARIGAIGVAGQAPTAVLVGSRGEVVRPAILWLDTRAEALVGEIDNRLGAGRCWTIARNRLHGYYLGPKLRWLRCHEPAALERTALVLQSHAWIVFRMTGTPAIDPSTAALCAPLWDPVARAWSTEACEALEIAPRVLPAARASHDIAGPLTEDAARSTGLRAGTPVAVGGGDFAAATLGVGVVEQGEAALMLGTAGNLLMPLDGPDFDPRLINTAHVGCDRYLTLGGTLAGAVQEWFRATMAPGVAFETLDAEAAAVPPGAEGVLLLPYLQGERTPLWNSRARGAFVGLSLAHGRGHLYRAVLEGIALSFRHCQAVVAERGVAINEVVAVNGGGRSALWRQILADVLGARLAYAPSSGGTAAGAAMLAGLGAGLLASPAEGKRWRGALVHHAPDAGAHARYDELFRIRLDVYASLADRFDDLHRLAGTG